MLRLRRTDPMATLAHWQHKFESERLVREEAEHRAERAEEKARQLGEQLSKARAANRQLAADVANGTVRSINHRSGRRHLPEPASSGRRHGPESAG